MTRVHLLLGAILLALVSMPGAAAEGVAVGVAVGENERCIEHGAECDWDSSLLQGQEEVRVAVTVAGHSSCVSSQSILCTIEALLEMQAMME